MKNHKIVFTLLCAAMFFSFASAELLANVSVDKTTLSTDEVGLISIRIFNDSDKTVNGLIIRASADEQIVFLNNTGEQPSYYTQIDSINSGEGKEIITKIKAISTQKQFANIYVYYGTSENLTHAAVVRIETKELEISKKVVFEKKTLNGNETITINFTLNNTSNSPLTKIAVGTIAPNEFDDTTGQYLVETLAPGSKIEKTFNLVAPIETKGEQKILLAYGYFDTNTPHYFEKQFSVVIQKPNYGVIILLGMVVLVIAAYLYIKKDDKKSVKGTAEKK